MSRRIMPSLRTSKPDKVHASTASLDTDGDSGIDVAGYPQHDLPVKRTVAEYYTPFSGYLNPFPIISSTTLSPSPSHPPPSYYDTRDQPSLRPGRIPVSPREEEGREQLPEYYCSVHREAVFHTKMELSSPFDRATDRSWSKEYVVLHGTLLRMHKARRIPFFATPDMRSGLGEDGSTRPEGWMPGELTKSFTLQGAEVGIATDYKKRHFVIRVRAETEQFLLSSKSVDECIAWLEDLSAAVDLSPALEERTLPRYQSVAGRRRRRGHVIEEQERIIRSQFPHLVEGITEEEDEVGSRRDSTSTADGDELMRPSTPVGMRRPRDPQEATTEQGLLGLRLDFGSSAAQAQPQPQIVASPSPASSTTQATGVTSSTSSSSSSPPRRPITGPPASITASINMNVPGTSTGGSEGKLRPPNTLSPEANLRYVRRCMAVLRDDSPRLSDYVIKEGRRYRLEWEKKQLVPEGGSGFTGYRHWKTAPLPQYEDLIQGREEAIEPATQRPLTPRRMPPGPPGVGPSRTGSRLRAASGRLGWAV